MKLERNGIVAIVFAVTFVILLLFSLITSGFRLDLKGILVAVYFSIWVGAVAFVILTFVIPYIAERKKEPKKGKSAASAGSATPTPFKSPRSNLPVRERIVAYVAERRREDGLSAPEPLRPSKNVTSGFSGAAGSAAAPRVAASGIPPVASASPQQTRSSAMSGSDDMGDLPLPDDFGSVDDGSGDMGGLPGLDDDYDDMGGFGGDDDMSPDFGGDHGGLLDDSGPGEVASVSAASSGMSGGELPGFDGDLDPGFGESDLMSDDGMMDLSGDDVLTMDDDDSPSVSSSSSGGLSDDGLDLGDTLDPDLLDSDLSSDDDFGDIEFMDLEPEEPKKGKK